MIAAAIYGLGLGGVIALVIGAVTPESVQGPAMLAGGACLALAAVLFLVLVVQYAFGAAVAPATVPPRRKPSRRAAMATQVRRERIGGFSVLRHTIPEAIAWALVAHLVYNRWADMIDPAGTTFAYGWSLVGAVALLIDQIVPEQWVPLLIVVLCLAGTLVLAFKFMPLLKGAWHRPAHTLLTALIVFGITLGLFEAIYYGMTGGRLYFDWNMLLNTVPPLVVATVIIAGRGSRVYLQETGARDTVEVEDMDEPVQ